MSLAAQAATLPIVLASFGRLAIVAPAVNLAIVPIVAPAMAAGMGVMAGRCDRRAWRVLQIPSRDESSPSPALGRPADRSSF